MSRFKPLFAPPFGSADWHNLTHAAQDTLKAVARLAPRHFTEPPIERRQQKWCPVVLEFVRLNCTHIHYPGNELPRSQMVRRVNWLRQQRLVLWEPRGDWLYVRADVVKFIRRWGQP